MGAGALQQGGTAGWALQGPCFPRQPALSFRKPLSSAVLGPCSFCHMSVVSAFMNPSHINVIIRANIYTGFLLSSNSSCLQEIHFIFPAWLVQGYYSIYVRGQIGRKEAGGGEMWQRQKEKGLTHPTSSPMRLEDDQEHHTDLCSSRSGLPSMNSPSAAR